MKAAQAKLYLMALTLRQQIQLFTLEYNWRLPGDLIEYSLILVHFHKALRLDILRNWTKVEMLEITGTTTFVQTGFQGRI